MILDTLERALRRNSALPRMSGLRRLFRRGYHWVFSLSGNGLHVRIGGALDACLPAAWCSREIESYEPDTAQAIQDWYLAHPGGRFVDIGCSLGYFSCGVGFLDPNAEILAVDADIESLAVTRKMCRYMQGPDRLHLILGLIGFNGDAFDHPTSTEAIEWTRLRMDERKPTGDIAQTGYVGLKTGFNSEQLPRYTLDGLLADFDFTHDAPEILIKCDVEGAEWAVLQGATRLLESGKATFLLSVHPELLPEFGGSVDEIRTILQRAGYSIKELAVDHEEHWLCLPRDDDSVSPSLDRADS